MQVILEVPDRLKSQLERHRGQLPAVLERALVEIDQVQSHHFDDESEVLEVLASAPAPDEVLALSPSPALAERMHTLLEQNKTIGLSASEEAELDRYFRLEHLVRLAKVKAAKRLSESM